MRKNSAGLIDTALTIFAMVVAVVYFGGYYFPHPVGNWTGLGMLFYLLMLLLAVIYQVFQYLARSKNDANAPQQTKKGSNRS